MIVAGMMINLPPDDPIAQLVLIGGLLALSLCGCVCYWRWSRLAFGSVVVTSAALAWLCRPLLSLSESFTKDGSVFGWDGPEGWAGVVDQTYNFVVGWSLLTVPCGVIGLFVALVSRLPRRVPPAAEPTCPACGYIVRGLPSRRCPECGNRF